MTSLEQSSFSLDEILRNELIEAHFQPIISIKRKSVCGLEGLCRGQSVTEKKLIPPFALFERALIEDRVLELDRLCRKRVLEQFQPIYEKNNTALLFLNFEISIIDKGVVGSGNIVNTVRKLGINPKNIVIEIIESKVNDTEALKDFVATYKDYGFLIALDDFGAGHSNLDRIAHVKPDILKIDRSIISNIDKEYYKQEIFKSLVSLSHRVGSLVLAEGTETEEEIFTCLELGADLFQGFYFKKPEPVSSHIFHMLQDKIEYISYQFRNTVLEKINSHKFHKIKLDTIMNHLIAGLLSTPLDDFDARLKEMIYEYPSIECAYILNEMGIQTTETIFNTSDAPIIEKKLLFHPAVKGSGHSLKDYYFFILSGLNQYITEPYISMATGRLCITVSSLFRNIHYHEKFILCIDLNPDFI
ncbi:MAG TPA: hypothetical protein DHW82_13780 [Spirochaetia bacterium]|nr:MAG: hypothetical protein A2Y41_09255 [Spirochaetes bacterium GWB1_36_13]HCL58060.1 hypothetical protein [Spirochaetia bacterium]